MSPLSLYQRWMKLRRPGWEKKVSEKRRGRSLHVETLEDRTVPTTFVVTSAADDGTPGTLRADLALAQDGDTIRFSNSLAYQTITLTQGELVVGHSVSIQGLGENRLTISGNSASRIFETAIGTTVSISRLKVTDGKDNVGGAILYRGNLSLDHTTLANNSATLRGGALASAPFAADLTITSCDFTGNSVGFSGTFSGAGGGAIFSDSKGAVTIRGSTLTNNTATTGMFSPAAGGAIDIVGDGGSLTLSHCVLRGNSAVADGNSARGGAVALESPFITLDASNSRFFDNQAVGSSQGGAILLFSAIADSISQCTFEGNQAMQGGAIEAVNFGSSGALAVSSSTFRGNSATIGGGIDSRGMTLSISDSTFRENTATSSGGGLAGSGLSGGLAPYDITITNSRFLSNVANDSGGGVYFQTGRLSISGTRFAGNQAGNSGGGVEVQPSSRLTIDGSEFAHNRAGSPSGFFSGGGGLDITTDVFEFTNSTVTGNEVNGAIAVGGGVAIQNCFSTTINNVTIAHNRAIGGNFGAAGGGLLASGNSVSVSFSVFSDNTAKSTGGGFAQGGGIYDGANTFNLTDSVLLDNAAVGGAGDANVSFIDGAGGGVFVGSPNGATMERVTVVGNTARGGDGGGNGFGGGVFISPGVTLTMRTSTVTDNEATGGAGGLGQGGGVCNLFGTFYLDAFSLITYNKASTSDDNVFGPITPI